MKKYALNVFALSVLSAFLYTLSIPALYAQDAAPLPASAQVLSPTAPAPALIQRSQLAITFSYAFTEFENSLNQTFQDVIYVDKRFEDNNYDSLTAEVTLKGPIKVVSLPQTQQLRVTLPLRIDAVYKFDETIKGKFLWWEPSFELREHQPLEFDILLSFTLTPQLDQELRLQVQTAVDFEWLTFPYVSFYYFFKFRVTEQVQIKLQRTLQRYARERIDQALHERVDVKRLITQYQYQLANEPFILNAEQQLWGVADHLSVVVAPLEVTEQALVMQATFTMNLDLLWDEDGYQQLRAEYPRLRFYLPRRGEAGEPTFAVNASVRISPQALQKLMVVRMTREPIFISQGKNTMQVREVYFKAHENRLVVDVYLDMINRNDTFEMLATLFARPEYIHATGAIELRDVDYSLHSESFLLKLWNAANKERLQQAIIDNVRLPVQDLATEVKALTATALNELEFGSFGELEVRLPAVTIQDVFMDGNYLVMLVNFKGTAIVNLHQLF